MRAWRLLGVGATNPLRSWRRRHGWWWAICVHGIHHLGQRRRLVRRIRRRGRLLGWRWLLALLAEGCVTLPLSLCFKEQVGGLLRSGLELRC